MVLLKRQWKIIISYSNLHIPSIQAYFYRCYKLYPRHKEGMRQALRVVKRQRGHLAETRLRLGRKLRFMRHIWRMITESGTYNGPGYYHLIESLKKSRHHKYLLHLLFPDDSRYFSKLQRACNHVCANGQHHKLCCRAESSKECRQQTGFKRICPKCSGGRFHPWFEKGHYCFLNEEKNVVQTNGWGQCSVCGSFICFGCLHFLEHGDDCPYDEIDDTNWPLAYRIESSAEMEAPIHDRNAARYGKKRKYDLRQLSRPAKTSRLDEEKSLAHWQAYNNIDH